MVAEIQDKSVLGEAERMANEAGVPPYIVFSDASVRDMRARLPRTEKEFLDVKGVGDTKLERYGEAFLQEIVSFADT
jgi:ATP-dependent DNA helicase RecQ